MAFSFQDAFAAPLVQAPLASRTWTGSPVRLGYFEKRRYTRSRSGSLLPRRAARPRQEVYYHLQAATVTAQMPMELFLSGR